MYKIYGKSSCPYCDISKELLDKCGIEYEYIDLSLDEALIESLKSQGFRTVPVIYLGSDLIGGYESLQDHLLEKIM